MRLTLLLVVLMSFVGASGSTPLTNASVGFGHGIAVPGDLRNPCPGYNAFTLFNFDGSAENAYGWEYGGIAPPYYGSFAECYYDDWGSCICGIELLLTSVGNPSGPCDLYVWDDDSGIPGIVLNMVAGADPGWVAPWPYVSTHDFPIECNHCGPVWVGFWADWSEQACGYYVAADLDGPGGCPFTNIAPGSGYPTGWNNVSIVWGPTRSLGIGVWLSACPEDLGACCYGSGYECVMTDWGHCLYDFDGEWMGGGTDCDACDPSAVDGQAGTASLNDLAAFPNPSAGQVLLFYQVQRPGPVTLSIFDVGGSLVRQIAEGSQTVGRHVDRWDGRDAAGQKAPVGVYLTRIETSGGVVTGKVTLAR